ncbi:MAG: hypothetical protein GF364_06955 [Candidatus Lokiarchaeota archaeon]|nr:hypothetical protein [Candidatus Lokiarchaeota archaeon]
MKNLPTIISIIRNYINVLVNIPFDLDDPIPKIHWIHILEDNITTFLYLELSFLIMTICHNQPAIF